jgi:hypothetical protein
MHIPGSCGQSSKQRRRPWTRERTSIHQSQGDTPQPVGYGGPPSVGVNKDLLKRSSARQFMQPLATEILQQQHRKPVN